ncbi:MAG TPA: TrbG/VirB9 family P-type conjugative transfer protein [Coxiellaceae bacterium]|nr:TrbG/VirB9 family P-type conjugative transfer protein [Coxiellaceae bacterium]
MKQSLLISLILTLTAPTLYASQIPRSLATDPHIKVVNYDSNNVVTLLGQHQIDTAIEFDKEETILLVESGDSTAWLTEINKNVPYMLYLKPSLPSSDTNMTVVTTERRYQFHLMTSNDKTIDPTYLLVFKYPEKEKRQLQQHALNLQRDIVGNAPLSPLQWNYNYSFYGSKLIAPIQAVDNGKFTIFKFAPNINIPAIFSVDSHHNEAMINFRMDGDYIFIQGVFRQFTLRNGEDVTTIYNDNYRTR